MWPNTGCPSWTVNKDEYYADHCFNILDKGPLIWKLQAGNPTDQTELTSLVRYISRRRRGSELRLISAPHPWQADPPLQSRINIYLLHHYPKTLPAPDDWEAIQRNGRVWIPERHSRVVKLDASQYHLLLATYDPQGAQNVSSQEILNHISASCRAQNIAD